MAKRPLKIAAKIILGLALLVIGLAGIFAFIDLHTPKPADKDMAWGVTFSEKQANDLGLNWQQTYLAVLDDLKPKAIRLTAYWDLLQPTDATHWDFAHLDWQVQEAQKRNIPVIISIGQKVPRWPECYYPSWLNKDNVQERQDYLLKHIQTVVEHYKNQPNLLYWQVENEPFLALKAVNCPKTSYKFVASEVNVTKSIDPIHPVILTDSGQLGTWYKAANLGDSFGITYYRKVDRPFLGRWEYPYLPGRFSFIRWFNHKPNQPQMVIELQAEPWGINPLYTMTPQQQAQLFSEGDFNRSVAAAKQTGMGTLYFWGVEWWYLQKQKGNPVYWNLGKKYIDSGRQNYYFPPNFLWGASTSSHQVEGSTHNDWSEWEKQHATDLASRAQQKLKNKIPNWPTVQKQAQNPQNYISGVADDSYTRYNEDFDLAQQLGMNAQRISLEWSRIEPKEGQFDETELAHYKAEIDDLHAKHMEPFVTLWHWTVPTWFRDQGGWRNPNAVAQFEAYAQKTANYMGSDVTYWLTLNEPDVYLNNGYITGNWPPQKRSLTDYSKARNNLVNAHLAAYSAIKLSNKNAQVGIAKDVYAYDWPLLFRPFQAIVNWWSNKSFLNRIAKAQDFIGANYYQTFRFSFFHKNQTAQNDLGWRLNPQDITQVLLTLRSYSKPIYITENGLADASDTYRAQYIQSVTQGIARAIELGVDVRGYFHWSLLDNFEWAYGYWPQFGLIHVDRTTLQRTIRPSAWVYSSIIIAAQNGQLPSQVKLNLVK